MTGSDAVKAIVAALIKILGMFIPWLGTLLNIPVIGWIIGLVISWLTGLLYTLIERYARFASIDGKVATQVSEVKQKTEALRVVQSNPSSTKEQHDAALANFKTAVHALTHFDSVR